MTICSTKKDENAANHSVHCLQESEAKVAIRANLLLCARVASPVTVGLPSWFANMSTIQAQ